MSETQEDPARSQLSGTVVSDLERRQAAMLARTRDAVMSSADVDAIAVSEPCQSDHLMQ